jgi:hypothetical protein
VRLNNLPDEQAVQRRSDAVDGGLGNDDELLAEAFQAAIAKARELGWIV